MIQEEVALYSPIQKVRKLPACTFLLHCRECPKTLTFSETAVLWMTLEKYTVSRLFQVT